MSPLVVELGPSRAWHVALAALVPSAAAAAWVAGWPAHGCAGMVFASGLLVLLAGRATQQWTGTCLRWGSSGEIELTPRAGRGQLYVLEQTLRLGPLLVLVLRGQDGSRLRLAIWRDMLAADDWRRLVVREGSRQRRQSSTDSVA